MGSRTLTLLLGVSGILPLAFWLEPRPAPPRRAEDDGRAGTVVDRQGFACVRAVGHERWAPLGPRDVLLPGDQIRTDPRGANAVEFRLGQGGAAVLGPGALVEVVDGGHLRLMAGEAEVKGQVRTTGPGDFTRTDAAAAVLRVRDGKTLKVDAAPRWLTGYRASTTDEWLGSLLATVDGRDVPLTVGYHKVDVVIRDQIARTTIEESFVNATTSRLEGVFQFPLPADASISGFGMWIGDELVEADIVEKQKARAIYEDILRRKKDPGLLEWSGGNLFKARVFPIEPQSEKRIRIQYTQVLPLCGDRLAWRYALRSELLRAHPVRELRIAVQVDSTMPIRAVASPTHATRIRSSARSAVVEFDAKEYAPDKDFEVQVQVDRGNGITLVPHRRGSDGYFMLLLAPPDAGVAGLQRAQLPEGGKLDLVLMADTSGSMAAPARQAQAQFLGALLGLLSPRDTFRLMTCDVSTHWLADQPLPVTPENTARALEFVAARASLGWSDLGSAFAAVRQRVAPGATVIYVGDGIDTAGDGDAAGVAARLRQDLDGCGATCHAVSASASYEAAVLAAIASVGGGSVRALDDDPARTAFALLAEAAQPVVKDLTIEFRGLTTARVYPERLPNLPAGSQQVVLGRFLPTATQGGDGVQRGAVEVRGTLAGKPVRYTAELLLAEGDAGNSFVPRLWARRHLDALLARGTAPEVKQEIIAFSEEFGIITPYTSFLVLENDEDRARYGVERRMRMRDGEAFFAQGRDRARTEVLRQQMLAARTYRLGLRQQALREIAGLGRALMTQWQPGVTDSSLAWGEVPPRGTTDGFFAGSGGARTLAGRSRLGEEESDRGSEAALRAAGEESELALKETPPAEPADDAEDAKSDLPATLLPAATSAEEPTGGKKLPAFDDDDAYGESKTKGAWSRARRYRGPGDSMPARPANLLGFQRFPALGAPLAAPRLHPDPTWPAEVLALLRAVAQQDLAGRHDGPVAIERRVHSVRPESGDTQLVSDSRVILGAGTWCARSWWHGGLTDVAWLADGQRTQVQLPTLLGRRRPALADDAAPVRHLLGDGFAGDLIERYRRYQLVSPARIADGAPVRIELRTTWPADAGVVLVVDPTRKTLLQVLESADRRVTRRVDYADFVAVAGAAWPTTATLYNERDELVQRTEWTIRALTVADAAAAVADSRRDAADALLLDDGVPTAEVARRRHETGQATLADRLRLLSDAAQEQQWDRALEHLAAAEALARSLPGGGQPGLAWVRADLLAAARSGPALLAHAGTLAERMAAGRDPRALTWELPQLMALLADHASGGERRTLLLATRPAFFPTPEVRRDPLRRLWLRQQADLASRDGLAEAVEVRRQILAEWPDDVTVTAELFQTLVTRGQRDAAEQLLRTTMAVARRFSADEIDQLYGAWTDALWQWRQPEPLLQVLAAWTARGPRQGEPYVRYLTALLLAGREQEADQWLAARMAEPIPPRTDAVGRARLTAAIQCALGTGWNLHLYRLDVARADQLAALARRLLAAPEDAWRLAEPILGDWRFHARDVARALRDDLRRELQGAELLARGDLWRLAALARHAQLDRSKAADATQLRQLVDATTARWRGATDPDQREHALHVALAFTQQLEDHAGRAELVRARLAAAAAPERRAWALQLREELAELPLTPAIAAELLALLTAQEDVDAEAGPRSRTAGGDVRRVAAILQAALVKAALGPVEALEQLSRDERRLRTQQAGAAARQALIERFAAAQGTAPESCRPWLWVERLGFAAELGKDHAAVAADARELLASVAVTDAPVRALLEQRAVLVLDAVAVHPKAPPAQADATLALFRTRLAAAPPAAKDSVDAWRSRLFTLLLALDRPGELETALRGWLDGDASDVPHAIALGYLLAETGRLREAATVFEGLLARKALAADRVRHLADWYLALGEDDRRAAALRTSLELTPDYQLSNRLHSENRRVSRHGPGVPAELDPELPLVAEVLLGKSSQPQYQVWAVQQLYQTTKDFRVLGCLPDGVVGHTPEGVFGFLDSVRALIENVHEEATCDALRQGIDRRVAAARSDADRRGLWLLAALVERRAGLVRNQPGPHEHNGVAMMQAAFALPATAAERRLHASWLASLGAVPGAAYRSEQLRELRAFHAAEARGTAERCTIGLLLWQTLWNHGAHDEAIDGLTADLAETRPGPDAPLPEHALSATGTLVDWLVDRRRFAVAEQLVRAEAPRSANAATQRWFLRLLPRIWVPCLQHRGRVALGEGEHLYRAARAQMLALLWQDDGDQRHVWCERLCALHVAAHQHAQVATALADLEQFAQHVLPEVATTLSWGRSNVFATAAQAAFEIAGPVAGLRILTERLEHEPRWLARVNEEGWRQFGSTLATWRHKADALGDLQPRVLRAALAALERDLVECDWRVTAMFQRDNTEFWREQADAFATVAARVLETFPDSQERVLFATEYLWSGLDRRAPAVDALTNLDARHALRDAARFRLAQWLLALGRARAAADHLTRLVASAPLVADYRPALVRALFRDGRAAEAEAQIRDARAAFTTAGLWTGTVMAALGEAAVDGRCFGLARELWEEAIARHQRTARRRGIGDAELARYQSFLARTWSGLGDTDRAVDAAGAAVVAWGENQPNRQEALAAFRTILAAIPDLAAFLARRDADVARTGVDAPLLRRLVGEVLRTRGLLPQAIQQFELARALEPDDRATLDALVEAYEKSGALPAACQVLMQLRGLVPLDLTVAERLAADLERVPDAAGAERAFTDMVERAPDEADSHSKLAERREAQKRTDDALFQWRQAVRIRSLEPAQWLQLARAELRAGRPTDARRTLQHVLRTAWRPEYADPREEAGKLLAQIPAGADR